MAEDEETKTETKVETKEQVYELVNIPTQHETMIQTPDGTVIDAQSGIVMLLNKMDRIEKLVG